MSSDLAHAEIKPALPREKGRQEKEAGAPPELLVTEAKDRFTRWQTGSVVWPENYQGEFSVGLSSVDYWAQEHF